MIVAAKQFTFLIFFFALPFVVSGQAEDFVVVSSHFPYGSEQESLRYNPGKSARYHALKRNTWIANNSSVVGYNTVVRTTEGLVHLVNCLEVPASLRSKKIILHFSDVTFDYTVEINGRSMSQFRPIKNIANELDLSGDIDADSLAIKVRIFGQTTTSISWFSDVYAYTIVDAHVSNININGYVEEGRAKLAISWAFTNFSAKRTVKEHSYRVRVYDEKDVNLIRAYGQTSGGKLVGHRIDSIGAMQKKHFTYYADVEGASFWTAETPTLYRITMEFFDASGITTEVFSDYVGFRTITQTPTGFALNSSVVKFRGLELDRGGREAEDLLKHIKEINGNSIMLHLQHVSRSLLTICDSLGIYVVFAFDSTSINTNRSLLNYYQALQHHPSIVLWYYPGPGAQRLLSDVDRKYHFWKNPLVVSGRDRKNKKQLPSLVEVAPDDPVATEALLTTVNLFPTFVILNAGSQLLPQNAAALGRSINSRVGLSGFFLANYSMTNSLHYRPLFETILFEKVDNNFPTISILNCRNFLSGDSVKFVYEYLKDNEILESGMLSPKKIRPWEVIQVNIPNRPKDLRNVTLRISAQEGNVTLGAATFQMH